MSKARDLANAGTALTTVSATELGYLDGVTSAVQTQLNAKQATVSGVNDTEIGYLDGVTSAIQTQLNAKEATLPSQTGNSGKYLTTDGTNKSWGTVSSGGMTLIATATPSGATGVSFSSIPQSYKQLMVVWKFVTFSSPDTNVWVRLNGDSTAGGYVFQGNRFNSGSPTTISGGSTEFQPVIFYAGGGGNYGKEANGFFNIYRADQNETHFCTWQNASQGSSGGLQFVQAQGVHTASTSYVSSIDFVRSSSQTITGTFYLYGIN